MSTQIQTRQRTTIGKNFLLIKMYNIKLGKFGLLVVKNVWNSFVLKHPIEVLNLMNIFHWWRNLSSMPMKMIEKSFRSSGVGH